jgi:hypothetical protein
VSNTSDLAGLAPGGFWCELIADDNVGFIRATGELDLATVDQFDATLGAARDADFDHVVLDLTCLAFIDCCGMQRSSRHTGKHVGTA